MNLLHDARSQFYVSMPDEPRNSAEAALAAQTVTGEHNVRQASIEPEFMRGVSPLLLPLLGSPGAPAAYRTPTMRRIRHRPRSFVHARVEPRERRSLPLRSAINGSRTLLINPYGGRGRAEREDRDQRAEQDDCGARDFNGRRGRLQ